MKDLKENLPLVTVVLILLGVFKTYYYYRFFYINITSYLDFSEVIQLQYPFFLGVFCVVGGLASRFAGKILTYYDRHFNSNKSQPSESNIYEKYDFGLRSAAHLVTMFSIAAIFTMCVCAYDAACILLGKPDTEVSLMVNDKPVKTDNNYMFLGRTKSYIFFYDRKAKHSDVFANSDVKNLSFSEGKDYKVVKEIAPVKTAIAPTN